MSKIFPPVWLLLAIAAMFGLDRFLPIGQIVPNNLSYWASGVVGLIGLVTIAASVYLFKTKQTTILPMRESSYLITEGIFGFSRNPIYLGMVLILLSVAFYFGSLTPFLIVPIFAGIIQELFIKPEETMLSDKFAEAYPSYKAKVRRWL